MRIAQILIVEPIGEAEFGRLMILDESGKSKYTCYAKPDETSQEIKIPDKAHLDEFIKQIQIKYLLFRQIYKGSCYGINTISRAIKSCLASTETIYFKIIKSDETE